MFKGDKINWVEIDPISAPYYKIHTISILQVRKLVVQITSTSTSRKTCTTSTSTSYKWGKIGPWFFESPPDLAPI